jgi:monomeric isocitrate dehydrogenase
MHICYYITSFCTYAHIYTITYTQVGIDVVKSDISLSSRIISQFPKYLSEEQKVRIEFEEKEEEGLSDV